MKFSLFIVTVFLFDYLSDASTRDNVQPDQILKISLERNPEKPAKKVNKNGKEENISLENNHNWAYAGIIEIGNPPQKVRIEFDTGSSDVWVISSTLCEDDPKTCEGRNSYNHSKSSSYQSDGRELTLNYGTEVASGFISKDDLVISGLKVEGQFFLEVTSLKVNFNSTKYPEKKDGILGLGLPGISMVREVTGQPTVLSSLIDKGLIKRPMFSFYLGKVTPSSTEAGQETGGELVLGGLNPDHFTGDITYAPLIEDATDWFIKIDELLLGEYQIGDDLVAVIDSGTSLIQGPEKIIDPIRKAVFGNEYTKKTTVVDCSKIDSGTLPDVTVIINGVKFVLTPEDYIVKEYSNKNCVFGFSEFKGKSILIGNVFMRKFYTIFDVGNLQIGFATAK